MVIRVFGKKDCKLCKAAKEKLFLMNLPFDDSVELAQILTVEAFLKDRDFVTTVSAVANDIDTLPVIAIDRKAYSYPEAMKELRTHFEKEVAGMRVPVCGVAAS